MLLGCLLGNSKGIENWKRLSAARYRGRGRQPARIKSGSGAVEKNVEVAINRHFKRQGHSWNPQRAERLLHLKLMMNHERQWTA